MNKIIQLTESEYNKLNDLATATEETINEKALKMYEERGVCAVYVSISDSVNSSSSKYKIKVSTGVYGERGGYVFSDADRLYLEGCFERSIKGVLEERFGQQINFIEYHKQKLEYLRMWKSRFVGGMIFGWLAALALLVVAISKC